MEVLINLVVFLSMVDHFQIWFAKELSNWLIMEFDHVTFLDNCVSLMDVYRKFCPGKT
jgi:hypothetical protein